jgi:dipeptidyl aminopeptidase/acylaminoacyl peptidase
MLVAVLVVAAASLTAQQRAKKPITHDVYDKWRSIQGTRIARDGSWLVYALVAQDGDGELVVKNLAGGTEHRHPRGSAPVLTVDNTFVVFTIVPPKSEVDKAKKDKKKPEEMPKNQLGIMSLADGKVTTIDRVKSFKVPEESGRFVACLLEAPLKKAEAPKPEEKKEPAAKAEEKAPKKKEKDAGTELVVRELATGTEAKAADVIEYAWSKDGAWLAFATASPVSSKIPSDGAFVRRVADGTVKTLLAGEGHYKSLTFDEAGTQFAFLTDRDSYKDDAPAFRLYHWVNTADAATQLVPGVQGGVTTPDRRDAGPTARDAGPTALAVGRASRPSSAPGSDRRDAGPTARDAAQNKGAAPAPPVRTPIVLPDGMAVSENGAPEFSKDGSKLFFGIAPSPKADSEDAPEPLKVDLWHWKDAELQPMQKVRAEEVKKQNYRSMVTLKDGRFVRLATPDVPAIRLSDDASAAIATSDVPYRMLVSWDSSYTDVYALNLADGSKRKLLEKSRFGASLSPGGTCILNFDPQDNNWYSIRLSDGKKTNLTAKLGVHFENEEADTPEPAPAYGVGGWTEGDKSVLVYDEFDVWEIKPDGSGARMITKGLGRKNHVVFRCQRIEGAGLKAGVSDPFSPAQPLLLSATDDVTKATGYYRLPSLVADAEPAKIVMLDKLFGGLQKSRNADRLVFTLQRFDEFPNVWVSDDGFANMQRVSDAVPQQADYVWGKSELIEYTNADGVKLRAVLTKPDNFDPSKKYPLMVYIYERLTDGLHRHTAPAPGTSINMTRYVSNGYVLLQPDIIYKTGYPGQSALRCVVPAVEKVLSMGFIDPKRVGIQGHSWGGYQITYLITQTNMFAAVEAGASVSDMISAYGGIRWGSGMVRQFQYEHTQSRIGAPPWERPLQFIENSPVFWVEKVQTPYLTIHNDEDDAVPWYQGIEFFTALRRLGKEAYMFVFNGEKHGLRERENMKYFTVHMAEFFDHYLLGAPRPEWMDKGVPYLERGKRDLRGIYGTKGSDK